MIHLKHIDDNAIDFINDVINHKRNKNEDKPIIEARKECIRKNIPSQPPDKVYKERCHFTLIANKRFIEAYDTDYAKDKWNDIVPGIPHAVNNKDNEEFQDLYSYSFSPIVKYRERLDRDNNGRTATCPICEASAANSLDHYIPQNEYPLYVVHPRNLIPCCTECNGHKQEKVIDDNKERLYWNAFLDEQPTEQYLFCSISANSIGLPKCEYEIKQGNIDNKLWKIIKKTFEDFELINKYRIQSKDLVNKLRDKIITPVRDSRYSITKAIEQERVFYTSSNNVNNWVYVTEKALLFSDIFKNTLVAELTRLGIKYTI